MWAEATAWVAFGDLSARPVRRPVRHPALRRQKASQRPLGGVPGSHAEPGLTGLRPHGLLRIVTDTDVRLWRRVHMDLVRYAGCVCHPSC
ncbi:putative leader peptide [Streptomyces sp. NPDC050732]|uniref:putative leader peptide n=1 Tax=Streptomyces sp. NPDC050732 TaxID=3154632 RepID=UPI00343D6D21